MSSRRNFVPVISSLNGCVPTGTEEGLMELIVGAFWATTKRVIVFDVPPVVPGVVTLIGTEPGLRMSLVRIGTVSRWASMNVALRVVVPIFAVAPAAKFWPVMFRVK